MKLLSVTKIWDRGEHNAFTDLIRFDGRLYCAFREGSAHVSPDGALRVLVSADEGASWHEAALIRLEEGDLRDARLLVWQGQLYLFGARAIAGEPLQSLMWRSPDGCHWQAAEHCADTGYWLWRVIADDSEQTAPNESALYGVAYRPGPDGYVRLYRAAPKGTLKGADFTSLVVCLNRDGYVNETGLEISDGTFTCLLRRDPVWDDRKNGLLGKASTPFTDWQWLELDCRIGGPVAFRWRGRLLAIVRLYDEKIRTSLVEICETTGHVAEHLSLPSGGDTSYAGVVMQHAEHSDELKVSYYSSHEGKTAIYFAAIRLE
ncbi:exo-alpha-sialidase [Shewanella sp. FJAT-52076]|uniref:exo-alpha-sialidase n=1 Tax=Shewanella sp. FJAT-52076 TaxID=2864202 RepID=UPI001C6612C9|nr:exo-alpha-sialidase [Shewanella sp. FJAT-52076]QYJ73922.1 exo-alpha-sialidase [Shewanella sp. FJAT-52076]